MLKSFLTPVILRVVSETNHYDGHQLFNTNLLMNNCIW